MQFNINTFIKTLNNTECIHYSCKHNSTFVEVFYYTLFERIIKFQTKLPNFAIYACKRCYV